MKAVHFSLTILYILRVLTCAKVPRPNKELPESLKTIDRDELLRTGIVDRLRAQMDEGRDAYNLWLRQNPEFLVGFLTILDERVVGLLLAAVDDETLEHSTSSGDWTLLHKVVAAGRPGVVKLLLNRGLDPSQPDNKGFSALESAFAGGNVPVISVLVKNGGRLARIPVALASLLGAAQSCDCELLDLLLQALEDAPSLLAHISRFEAFPAAAVQCDADFIDMLLQHDEFIETRSDGGNTWLIAACAAGNEDVADLLLTHGANVNAKNLKGFSSLHAAASAGNVQLVTLLLDNGADMESVNTRGETPLVFSFLQDDLGVSSLLIQRGANVTHRDRRELTPLHRAAVLDNVAAVTLLLQSKAEVNAVNSDGFTPLMEAIKNRSYKVVEVLLEAGADVWTRGPGGVSALSLAARAKDMRLLERLIELRKKQHVYSP